MSYRAVIRIVIFCLASCGATWAFASVTANSFLPLSPGNGGQPRIQFSESTNVATLHFTVARGRYGNTGGCLDANETFNFDSATNTSWCSRDAQLGTSDPGYSLQQPSGGAWIYTDKLIALDDVDLREFKYSVKVAGDTATVAGWTASCAINEGQDPLLGWVAAFNQQSGSQTALLTRTDIPDPSATNPSLAQLNTVTRTYTFGNNLGTASTKLYILANDKYVAVFGPNGMLAGLTHRALGSEFINFAAPQSPIWQPAWIITAGTATATTNTVTAVMATPVPYLIGNQLSFVWFPLSACSAPGTPFAPNNCFSSASGFQGMTVTNTWTLASSDAGNGAASGLRAHLTVSGHPDSDGFLAARFPMLNGLGANQLNNSAQQMSDLVWPQANNAGLIFKNSNANVTVSQGTLLNEMQMPFFGVLSNGFALYMAAEDPLSRPKYFYYQNYWLDSNTCQVTGKCAGATFIDNYPSDGTGMVGNTLQANYDVAVKPMCGGWERVAKQYRAWATQQSWALSGGTAKTLSNRSEIPLSVRNGLFWWTTNNGVDATPGRTQNYIQNTLKPLIGPSSGGVPVGFHYYQWYTTPMDHNLPIFIAKAPGADPYNYTPASPVVSIPGLISTVQSDGSVVMPYINANSIDITNRAVPNYANYHGSGVGCAQDTTRGLWDTTLNYGGYNGPINGSSKDFGMLLPATVSVNGGQEDRVVSCLENPSDGNAGSVQMFVDPSIPEWQGIVNYNVGLVYGLGAGAVYLDAFGNQYTPDYSPAHGHNGHGSWWLDGRAAIAANAAAAAVTAESNTAVFNTSGVRRATGEEYFVEPLMQSIDVVMNYHGPQPSDIPLIGAVYSGYQMMAGGAHHEATSDAARAAVFGRSFVWGNQLMAVGTYALCADITGNCANNYPVVNYVRNLAAARHSAFLNNYLAYGELLQLADDINTATSHSLNYSGSDAWCSAATCSGTLPVVRGARWRSGNNPSDEVIVLTNTDLNNTLNYVLLPLPSTWHNGVSLCNYDNTSCTTAATGTQHIALSMAPGDIKILKKN